MNKSEDVSMSTTHIEFYVHVFLFLFLCLWGSITGTLTGLADLLHGGHTFLKTIPCLRFQILRVLSPCGLNQHMTVSQVPIHANWKAIKCG